EVAEGNGPVAAQACHRWFPWVHSGPDLLRLAARARWRRVRPDLLHPRAAHWLVVRPRGRPRRLSPARLYRGATDQATQETDSERTAGRARSADRQSRGRLVDGP